MTSSQMWVYCNARLLRIIQRDLSDCRKSKYFYAYVMCVDFLELGPRTAKIGPVDLSKYENS